jgi:hypothetical protein
MVDIIWDIGRQNSTERSPMDIKEVTYDDLMNTIGPSGITGFFRMSEDDYRTFPAINQSSLKMLLSKTPAHFKANWGRKTEDTPALKFGRDVHMLYGEPELFYRTYVREPIFEGSKRTKAYKDKIAEFEEANIGKEIMKAESWDKAHSIVKRLNSESHTALVTNSEESEICAFWYCPKREMQFKLRVDSINPKYVIDLKTTISAERRDFAYSVKKYHYDFQAAFYLWGISRIDPTSIHRFRFIAVEKDPPYETALYEASNETIARGWKKVEQTLDIFEECRNNDYWPGYGTDVKLV